jgi:protein TonB
MKIFQGKYLVVSLLIHSTVIISFLLFQKPIEKAETFMLITEIIEMEELSNSKHIKNLDNHKRKVAKKSPIIEKSNVKTLDIKAVLKPKTNLVTFKPYKLESDEKNDDIKKARIEKKSIKSSNSYKKTNENKISHKKNLSKANYKIGSINNPHPPYPLIARKKGLQGKLILEVLVNEDGSVKNVRIGKSSGYKILDSVSKQTIENWIFIPAKKKGRNVEDQLQVPIRFVLTE